MQKAVNGIGNYLFNKILKIKTENKNLHKIILNSLFTYIKTEIDTTFKIADTF